MTTQEKFAFTVFERTFRVQLTAPDRVRSPDAYVFGNEIGDRIERVKRAWGPLDGRCMTRCRGSWSASVAHEHDQPDSALNILDQQPASKSVQ